MKSPATNHSPLATSLATSPPTSHWPLATRHFPRNFLILPIKIYKVCLSPLLGNNCRFYPSCSSYSMEAIERHGCLKGLMLAGKRICKCHPFNPGGVDHVPGHEPENMESEYNE